LDKRPHRIVVLLDASGSMVDRPLKGRPWELALKIASNIAESSSENGLCTRICRDPHFKRLSEER
jgi:hypothetical protein